MLTLMRLIRRRNAELIAIHTSPADMIKPPARVIGIQWIAFIYQHHRPALLSSELKYTGGRDPSATATYSWRVKRGTSGKGGTGKMGGSIESDRVSM